MSASGIGVFLIVMGAGSFVLNLLGMEFRLLSWIDTWGPTVGIGIRIGFIAVGAILLFLSASGGGDQESDDDSLSRDAMRHL